MRVQALTPGDAEAYRQLRPRALHEEPAAFASSYDEERDLPDAVFADRLRVLPDRGGFGAFDDDRLVGIVTLGREDRAKLRHWAMIFGMYVAPEARGKGVARALLSEALTLARSVPELLQVALRVNAGNAAAIALYESLGFRRYGLEPGALIVDGRLHDELLMYCRLDRAQFARQKRTTAMPSAKRQP